MVSPLVQVYETRKVAERRYPHPLISAYWIDGVSELVASAGAWLESAAPSFVTGAAPDSAGAVVVGVVVSEGGTAVGAEEAVPDQSDELDVEAPSTVGDPSEDAELLEDGVFSVGCVVVELTNGGIL